MALLRHDRWDREIAELARWRDRRDAGTAEPVLADDDLVADDDLFDRIEQTIAVLAGFKRVESQLFRRVRRGQRSLEDTRAVRLSATRSGAARGRLRAWCASRRPARSRP